MEEKVFVIFNTTSIGDVLVTNTLVQNIKYYYKNSKIVFVCTPTIYDVAKYQDGVDDVVTFDKKTSKSLSGILNFTKNFPYKKPFASFVTYANERNLLLSRLIGAKHIISHNKFKLWNTKEKYPIKNYYHMKDRWGGMIEPLVGEYQNLPIKYNVPNIETPVIKKVKELKNPVAISTTSNLKPKDMSVKDCIELINLLNKEGYTPLMTGAGAIAREFVVDLKKEGCFDFVDIVDCTSFIELANVLKICNKCISVDTGTLHFANALQVPVVGIFYHGLADMWGADSTLYPSVILEGKGVNPTEIFNAFNQLCGVLV